MERRVIVGSKLSSENSDATAAPLSQRHVRNAVLAGPAVQQNLPARANPANDATATPQSPNTRVTASKIAGDAPRAAPGRDVSLTSP